MMMNEWRRNYVHAKIMHNYCADSCWRNAILTHWQFFFKEPKFREIKVFHHVSAKFVEITKLNNYIANCDRQSREKFEKMEGLQGGDGNFSWALKKWLCFLSSHWRDSSFLMDEIPVFSKGGWTWDFSKDGLQNIQKTDCKMFIRWIEEFHQRWTKGVLHYLI